MTELTITTPNPLDPMQINFTSIKEFWTFLLSVQLASPPVYSWDLYCELIYLKNLDSEEDGRVWILDFHAGSTYSDGSALGVSDFLRSLWRCARSDVGVHFRAIDEIEGLSDSHSIDRCKGLSVEGDKLIIRLKYPNPSFSRLLGKPEASLVPKDTRRHSITSGPFFASNWQRSGLQLNRNCHFPGFKSNSKRDLQRINWKFLSDELAVQHALDGNTDVCFLGSHPEKKIIEQITETMMCVPVSSQTYFFSRRNEQVLEDGTWDSLVVWANHFEAPFPFQNTHQLLSGSGMGRLDTTAMKKRSKTRPNSKSPNFNLGVVELPRTRPIIDLFRKQIPNANIITVNRFDELFSIEKADVLLLWNDFGANDPYIGLYNATNPQRPMIVDSKQEIRTRLQDIQSIPINGRDQAYRSLHSDIIFRELVFPLFELPAPVYARSDLKVQSMKGLGLWTIETP